MPLDHTPQLALFTTARDNPNQEIPYGYCQCGCGKLTKLSRQKDTPNGYAKGQPRRYVPGHGSGMQMAIAATVKHGMTSTKIYRYWSKIKQRCYDPGMIHYKDYGGRGIQVHESWRNDFLAFYEYISQLPDYEREGYTLDRIDNNGDYAPGNVRWADKITQANNTRKNVFYEFRGKRHTITEWARIVGIYHNTLIRRLKLGWTIEKALTTPPRKMKTSRARSSFSE